MSRKAVTLVTTWHHFQVNTRVLFSAVFVSFLRGTPRHDTVGPVVGPSIGDGEDGGPQTTSAIDPKCPPPQPYYQTRGQI